MEGVFSDRARILKRTTFHRTFPGSFPGLDEAPEFGLHLDTDSLDVG